MAPFNSGSTIKLQTIFNQTLRNTLAFSTATTSNVGVQRQMVLNTVN